MPQLNYNHLRYFYAVARHGSIVKASEAVHVSPQTISGQLSQFEDYLGKTLFDRIGKRLVLNDAGKMAYSYAEDIFSLGQELQQSLGADYPAQQFVFTVGITDVIPKILASNILKRCFELADEVKIVCREGDFEFLMGELALNKVDLVVSDRTLAPGMPIKAYSHELGESGVSFYATKEKSKALVKNFPQSLDGADFLICGDKSNQRINLQTWFEQEGITPNVVAEFDDSALMKYLGQAGLGAFCTPTTIEAHVTRQYAVSVVGRTESVTERYYAISPERKVRHPGVKLLLNSAREIFGSEGGQ
ncbi:MAG: transcriptional activator NhaR [Halioglobus sp.]